MYIPKQFQENDLEKIATFIQNNSFGMLVSTNQAGLPLASHIPMTLEVSANNSWKLYGHLARGNSQWKTFEEPNSQLLAIFTAPHSYISSSWYGQANVPTWNYVAIHLYGNIRLLTNQELYLSLGKLVDKYEVHATTPVSIQNLPPTLIHNEMRGIVGFELDIKKIEAAYKLSQNRTDEDYINILTHLHQNHDSATQAIISEMKCLRPTLFNDSI